MKRRDHQHNRTTLACLPLQTLRAVTGSSDDEPVPTATERTYVGGGRMIHAPQPGQDVGRS